jgi:DUF1009 family protein
MIALIGSLDPLTAQIANTLRAHGEPFVICVLGHRTDLDPAPGEPVAFRVEHLGTLLQRLGIGASSRSASRAGSRGRRSTPRRSMRRPFRSCRASWVPSARGDDGALRVVLGVFEEAGFVVLAAHELVPDLLPSPGILSAARPTAQHDSDAARAEAVHRIIAAADVGQGVIVRAGQVLAVEAGPGTDFMLRSVAGLAEGRPLLQGAQAAPGPARGPSRDRPPDHRARPRRRLGAVVVEAGGRHDHAPSRLRRPGRCGGNRPLGARARAVKVFPRGRRAFGRPARRRGHLTGLRGFRPTIDFDASAGEAMGGEGLHSRFPMSEPPAS